MGERSMETCLEEQLDQLRTNIPLAASQCGLTVSQWYDEGASFEALDEDMDPIQREAISYAWGYLNGVADQLDLTVREMLDAYGLSFDEERTSKKKRSRKAK